MAHRRLFRHRRRPYASCARSGVFPRLSFLLQRRGMKQWMRADELLARPCAPRDVLRRERGRRRRGIRCRRRQEAGGGRRTGHRAERAGPQPRQREQLPLRPCRGCAAHLDLLAANSIRATNTRRLLAEAGFLYHMDDYSDDRPPWDTVETETGRRAILVLPYALDSNDMKMWTAPARGGLSRKGRGGAEPDAIASVDPSRRAPDSVARRGAANDAGLLEGGNDGPAKLHC